jgi:hypothetical protein
MTTHHPGTYTQTPESFYTLLFFLDPIFNLLSNHACFTFQKIQNLTFLIISTVTTLLQGASSTSWIISVAFGVACSLL